MCGIAGHVAAGQPQLCRRTVDVMVDVLERRGPDSQGVESWPDATLGHRRLAILDLSEAGHQPMVSEDGQIGLVFNGCIYNFLELREELEKCGQRFRSRSDTEVLLRGYREWGIDALAARLRGMFAFAIWDEPRRTLILVRDRLGVKPLIYCERNGEIAFASTVAALHAAGFGGGVDPQAVLDFLEFGYVTEQRAIYEGISKLPRATILEWRDGHAARRRYWTMPEPREGATVRFEEAVEQTERLLVEAVRLRLISDVPVGALLSGGIDSALVCWAMRELNANIKAFTVRASDDSSDESAEAAHTARVLGVSHEIVDMPEADFSLDEATDAFSEPFSCPSAQAMLWVSSAVKRQATVLLTGDGGDEVFLGYPDFRNAWVAERLARRTPAAVAAACRAASRLLPRHGLALRLRNFVTYATGGLGDRLRLRDGLPYYQERSILGERLAGRQLPWRQVPASFESARRLFADAFAYHIETHFTCEFLPKVDGSTMYYALEARAPFLDQKIWEYAPALPPEVQFRGGRLKAVLREIARRHIGPEVAFRKKRGFTVPVERWLAQKWSGMLDQLNGDTLLEKEGWIRRGALEAPLREATARSWIPAQIWRLLILEHWLEKSKKTGA